MIKPEEIKSKAEIMVDDMKRDWEKQIDKALSNHNWDLVNGNKTCSINLSMISGEIITTVIFQVIKSLIQEYIDQGWFIQHVVEAKNHSQKTEINEINHILDNSIQSFNFAIHKICMEQE